jgi:hypothetical protein
MTTKPTKRVRCAVYTRVSTEYGLDQEFNSLDAQHEAAEAYVRSQAHDGWTPIRTRYDDGGYFGGSLAGACELVSRGARLWFHTKIIARRDFSLRVRTWEKTHGHIAEWDHRIAAGYRKAAEIKS